MTEIHAATHSLQSRDSVSRSVRGARAWNWVAVVPMLRLFGFLLVMLTGFGCSGSLPSNVESATLLRVSYYDFRTNTSFVLASVNDPQMKDLYSQRKKSANIKVTDDASLHEVVRKLAAADFFEHAGNIDNPNAIADQNPYKFIVVHADGQPYSLYLAKGVAAANKDIGVALSESATILIEALNEVQQLQWVDDGGLGSTYFEKERERVQKENAGKGGGGR